MTQRGAECNSIDEPCDTQDQAFRYIEVLTGDINSAVTYQTFDDSGGGDLPPQVLHGTLTEVWNDLCAEQDNGHGVFVMVQQGDGKGRAGKNVVALRALFLDDDKGTVKLSMLKACRPNIIVHSGRGTHYYWLLVAGEKLTDFGPAQKALAARFGTDPAVHDLPRVMRMPGTTHYKNRSDPQDVILVDANRRSLRTIADILELLGVKVAPVALGGASGTPPSVAAPKGRVLHCTPDRPKKRARSYIKTIKATEGERSNTAYRVACEILHGFQVPYDETWTLLCEWNLENCAPPLQSLELGKTLENARRYGKGEVKGELDVIAEVVARDASLDPSAYCYDTTRASAPWRPWRGTAWQEGVATVALDRLLENSGLDRHARDAWKRSVPVVISSEPVFSSRERLVATPIGLVANTFRPPPLTPLEGDCSGPLAVISNLVNYDDAAERWLVGWLARVVQSVYAGRPERVGSAPVLHGAKGAGKGVLEEMMKALLGHWNVASITQAELDSGFNSYLDGALLVVADEVFSTDSRGASLSAKVKHNLTALDRIINRKGIPQYSRPAVENWMFSSNAGRPVEAEKGDRRFTIIKTGPAIPVDLGGSVADDARAGGPGIRAFLHFLLSLDASKLAAKYVVLDTASKRDVVRASGNSATKFSAEVAELGFWSATAAWARMNGGREDGLYLSSGDGLRRFTGTDSPLLTRKALMDVYRAFCSEINAPAAQETTLLSALRDECPGLTEGHVPVAGRNEKVITGLPGMVRGEPAYAEPEDAATQKELF